MRVAVLGASGYAGGEVVRLIDGHPSFSIAYLGAHSQAGRALGVAHPQLSGGERLLAPNSPESVPDVDLAFMALPHGASAATGAALAARGIKVVDIGSDFRMDTAARYEEAYGAAHPLPEELPAWVYGLPELFRARIVGADRVAAPGCYPTSSLLALAPLLRQGLIGEQGLVINALSGVSGAGRALREDLLFGAVAESVRAYGVTNHRHRPEIEMGLELACGRPLRVLFTPHLMPMQRGMLATCTAPLARAVTRAQLLAALREAYADAPFVSVIDDPPQTRWVVGSNRAVLTAYVDARTQSAVVLSVIDNLLKGAAGQAVQCANLMCGLDEAAGLPRNGIMP
ncbi:MAG: N-acetyl-gamma-glutamyl-phosphate reductase [Proteobacteria bacterium]|nr:N-acetyl-gamma-glutamyl-phosphate reductase [Pseudomonadota bacterium]